MAFPPMSPTGAMSSGDYMSYMTDYCTKCVDSLNGEANKYYTKDTVNDWEALWERILDDTSAKITTLETAVAKINAQCRMVKDGINKL